MSSRSVCGDQEVSEEAVIQAIYDENSSWLDDELRNLDIEIRNPLLVVANLGLWYGRRTGYRILTGENVNEIFSVTCGDYVSFYADAYNIHCDDVHHDGTNHYLFRELIGDEDECAPLQDAIYEQKNEAVIKKLLQRYTRSILPYATNIYGWPVAGRKRKVAA